MEYANLKGKKKKQKCTEHLRANTASKREYKRKKSLKKKKRIAVNQAPTHKKKQKQRILTIQKTDTRAA